MMEFNNKKTTKRIHEISKITGNKNNGQIIIEAVAFYFESLDKKFNQDCNIVAMPPDGQSDELLCFDLGICDDCKNKSLVTGPFYGNIAIPHPRYYCRSCIDERFDDE